MARLPETTSGMRVGVTGSGDTRGNRPKWWSYARMRKSTVGTAKRHTEKASLANYHSLWLVLRWHRVGGPGRGNSLVFNAATFGCPLLARMTFFLHTLPLLRNGVVVSARSIGVREILFQLETAHRFAAIAGRCIGKVGNAIFIHPGMHDIGGSAECCEQGC